MTQRPYLPSPISTLTDAATPRAVSCTSDNYDEQQMLLHMRSKLLDATNYLEALCARLLSQSEGRTVIRCITTLTEAPEQPVRG